MLTALPRPTPTLAAHRGPVGARLALHREPGEPPSVREIADPDPAVLIERIFDATAAWTDLPVVALREIVENLAHADFAGALVTIFDGGATVRVSDLGPGIPDKALAAQPGFTTADPGLRRLIRGVGSGLPVAGEQMSRIGGRLDVCDNIGRGTVVTLSAASGCCDRPQVDLDQDARHLLALLVELSSADTMTLARELAIPVPDCGRALALLEHRALVSRSTDGQRAITPRGNDLIASLF